MTEYPSHCFSES